MVLKVNINVLGNFAYAFSRINIRTLANLIRPRISIQIFIFIDMVKEIELEQRLEQVLYFRCSMILVFKSTYAWK